MLGATICMRNIPVFMFKDEIWTKRIDKVFEKALVVEQIRLG